MFGTGISSLVVLLGLFVVLSAPVTLFSPRHSLNWHCAILMAAWVGCCVVPMVLLWASYNAREVPFDMRFIGVTLLWLGSGTAIVLIANVAGRWLAHRRVKREEARRGFPVTLVGTAHER